MFLGCAVYLSPFRRYNVAPGSVLSQSEISQLDASFRINNCLGLRTREVVATFQILQPRELQHRKYFIVGV